MRGARAGRGFTLIELVMAILVLAIGVPPIISIGTNCLQKLNQSAFITTATSLAQEKVEMVLADKDAPSRGYAYIVSANYPAESPVNGFTGYSRSVTIAADSTSNGVTFRNVTVTVTAPDGTQCSLFTWVINQ